MSHARQKLRGAALLAVALLACAAAPACGGADEGLVLVGGERVDATSIDRDPLALMPAGVLALGYLDAAAMFKTGLGGDVGRLTANLLPLGAESGFVPSRDVSKIYTGVYAMQGADFCVVLQGSFDVAAIGRAADARAKVPSGLPLVKTRYADADLYTAGNIGFTVLTGHTIVSGNETGIRRALDRLRTTKLERSIPSWMADLMRTEGAAFTIAGDLTSKPPVEKVPGVAPFVTGLRVARVVGNFQAPGINLAGTLTYADEPAAVSANAAIQNVQQLAPLLSLFSALGIGVSIPPVQLAQHGSEVAFTMPVDERFARMLLGLAVSATAGRVAMAEPPAPAWQLVFNR